VTLTGRRDLSEQVYRQIREAILDGRLRSDEALPSTRELARRLAVSRNTVGRAYDRLVAEGLLTSRAGAGTRVRGGVPVAEPGRKQDSGSPLRPRPVWDSLPPPFVSPAGRAAFDFRGVVPDVRDFPFDSWRSLVSRQLRAGAIGGEIHVDAAGHPGLREALARHVGVSRAVRAETTDVFVTSGSQQAFDLVTRVLLEPGDTVAVEDPGYPPARWAFTAHGAGAVGVPVDDEGMVVDAIPARARLVYLCPSHHYPLGVSMSLPRRLALLEWADRVNGIIVEDDYDSEFRYGGRPVEPLHSLDPYQRVLYVGSLSKVMLPTLRLGFLIAPAPLHSALRKAKFVNDLHTELPMQAAAADFIDKGLLAQHVRRLRVIYAERCQRITTALAGDLADRLTLIPSAAGLHIAALLRDGTAHRAVGTMDRAGEAADVTIARRALAVGVAVDPLSRMAATSVPRSVGFMFGYGAIPAERVYEGLRRLRACL